MYLDALDMDRLLFELPDVLSRVDPLDEFKLTRDV